MALGLGLGLGLGSSPAASGGSTGGGSTATWNPADMSASGLSLSTDKLTVTKAGNGAAWVRANHGIQPGEHKYFETTQTVQAQIGVVDASFSVDANGGFGAESPDACVFDANDSFICYGSGHTFVASATISGHRFGVGVDYTGTNPVVQFYIDGAATGGPTTMSSVTSAVYPAADPHFNTGSVTAVFSSSSWTQTPPAGASQIS